MTDTFTSPGSADVPRPRPAEPVIAPPIVPPAAAPTSPVPPLAPVAPPTPVASAAAAPTAAVRSGVGPRFVVGAVLVATVLASSGTYVAMRAADAGRGTASDTPVLTAANGTAAPGTPAPATQAPATQAPATPVPTTAPPAAGNGGGGTTPIVDIVKAVSPAVVTIVAEGVTEADPITGMTTQGTATGSGVIFDANGLILTNHHVVAGDPQSLSVHLKDGRSLPATIYGIDTMTDLAIVKVKETGLPTAPIGDSSTIQVGQTAIAIGSPLGTFTETVTSGILSATGRTIDVGSQFSRRTQHMTGLLQTDAAINEGNSGGPLLDAEGNVVGVNVAVATTAQGIGFAIPIDDAAAIMAQARTGTATG